MNAATRRGARLPAAAGITVGSITVNDVGSAVLLLAATQVTSLFATAVTSGGGCPSIGFLRENVTVKVLESYPASRSPGAEKVTMPSACCHAAAPEMFIALEVTCNAAPSVWVTLRPERVIVVPA